MFFAACQFFIIKSNADQIRAEDTNVLMSLLQLKSCFAKVVWNESRQQKMLRYLTWLTGQLQLLVPEYYLFW